MLRVDPSPQKGECEKCLLYIRKCERKMRHIERAARRDDVNSLKTLVDFSLSEASISQSGCDVHPFSFKVKKKFLHAALEHNAINAARFFIENGVDINQQDAKGRTALHVCCTQCKYAFYNGDDVDHSRVAEEISMLLWYGADPTIPNFKGRTPFDKLTRKFVPNIPNLLTLQENLLYYTIDEHETYNMNAKVFLRATQLDSTIFYELTRRNIKVVFNNSDFNYNTILLFTMKTEHLQIIIEKYDYVIKKLLRVSSEEINFWNCSSPVLLENFNVLLESKVKLEFADWFYNAEITLAPSHMTNLYSEPSSVHSLVCFLLSYGMTLHEGDLIYLYRRFGYCDMFKICLHMDIEKPSSTYEGAAMPRILYDFSLDVPRMIRERLFPLDDLEQLLPYFMVPSDSFRGIRRRYLQEQNRPQVSLLVELARNAFRKYFVERLGITSARQFYTLLDLLPISPYHKAIITLQVRLYDVPSLPSV